MSDYILASGYSSYGASSQPQMKSVYYPPQQQPSQQQLNPFPQGSQIQQQQPNQFVQDGQGAYQFPQGSAGQQQFPQGFGGQQQLPPNAVPVINMVKTPVKFVSFQQNAAPGSIPPQLQQQQQTPINSVYYYPPQQQQRSQRDGMKSVYYAPQQQPSQQQLNPFPQGSQLQQQLPSGSGAAPVIMNTIETPPGVKLVSFQQEVTAQIPPEFQQQFQQLQQALEKHQQQQAAAVGGSGSGGSALQGASSDYHFDALRAYGDSAQLQQQQPCQGQQQCPQQPQSLQQQPQSLQQQPQQSGGGSGGFPRQQQQGQGQQESLYIGMPNNLYLATSRPRDYHFQPQPHRQESNTNMLRTARENPSVTNLRVARSEENIRTAILNEEGKIVGVVETHYHPSQPQGQGQQQAVGGGGGSTLQGASSDYHFDALRGLNSAY